MRKKIVVCLLGVSAFSCLVTGQICAEEYYDDGSYSDTGYYDDGSYSDTGYYDDGSYSDTGYYDDGSYSDTGYYDDGSYSDTGYYDDGSYSDTGYYDDVSYSDDGSSYSEESYDDSASSSDSSEESSTEEASAKSSSDDDSWHQDPRTDIKRGGGERETPDVNGQVHSYLTGQLTDSEIALQRPVAVMINNIINALPQSDIEQASVIYEAPVEGEITRMMAIYDTVEGLDKIGPVRSCRDYYIDWALEFDAIYVHYGQAVYAYDLLNSDMVNNISGLQYQDSVGELNGYAGEDVFFRTSDRVAPHNCYTSGEGILKGIEKKEYSMELDNDYTGHFKFAADGETVTYSEGTATHIVPHQYSNHPYFDYDETTQKYLRSEYPDRSAGAAQIDESTGNQLSFDNVIIQYSEIQNYDDHGYLNINTNSGGDAILFTKGTYQHATWEKNSDWGPARYYDADGNEIAINQGKTWVCIVQDTKKDDTSFQ